jgi:hypothetical protein
LAREGVRQCADLVGAHRILTAAAAWPVGHIDALATSFRSRAQPNISLSWIAEQMPIQQEAERERYLEGFRASVWTNGAQLGLPVWQIFLIRTAGELNAGVKTTR